MAELPSPHIVTYRRGRDGTFREPHAAGQVTRVRALTRTTRAAGIASIGAAFGKAYGDAKAKKATDTDAILSGMQAAALPAALGGVPHVHTAFEAAGRVSMAITQRALARHNEMMVLTGGVAAGAFKGAAVAARVAAPVVAPIMMGVGAYYGFKSDGVRGAFRGALRAIDPSELATIAGAKSGLAARGFDAVFGAEKPVQPKRWWQFSSAQQIDPSDFGRRLSKLNDEELANKGGTKRLLDAMAGMDKLATYTQKKDGRASENVEDRRDDPPIWTSPMRTALDQRRAYFEAYGQDPSFIELNIGRHRSGWTATRSPAALEYTGNLRDSLMRYNRTNQAFEGTKERQAQRLKVISDLTRAGLQGAPGSGKADSMTLRLDDGTDSPAVKGGHAQMMAVDALKIPYSNARSRESENVEVGAPAPAGKGETMRAARIRHYGQDVHDIQKNLFHMDDVGGWSRGHTPAAHRYTTDLVGKLHTYHRGRALFELMPAGQARRQAKLKEISNLLKFNEADRQYEASHMQPTGGGDIVVREHTRRRAPSLQYRGAE